MTLDNINPVVYQVSDDRAITADEEDDDVIDEIDSREVFDILQMYRHLYNQYGILSLKGKSQLIINSLCYPGQFS